MKILVVRSVTSAGRVCPEKCRSVTVDLAESGGLTETSVVQTQLFLVFPGGKTDYVTSSPDPTTTMRLDPADGPGYQVQKRAVRNI